MQCPRCQGKLILRDRKVNGMFENYHWCDSCECEEKGRNVLTFPNTNSKCEYERLVKSGYYSGDALEMVGGLREKDK